MTRMLASVTGPDEALLALAGGADIVDLKDPAQGAFGAVAPAVVAACVAALAGAQAARLSAVTGETPMLPQRVLEAATALADAGVAYVKQGIFAGGDAPACIRALAPLAQRVRLVAVLFADRAPDLSLLEKLAEAGFAGAMLDTEGKDGRRLLDHMDLPMLRGFVNACQGLGLFAGLAGSLEAPDIPRLLVLGPAVLGFRGALCGKAGRAGKLDPAALAAIRGLIPPETAGADPRKTDYRLLAARGYSPPDPDGDPALFDRVFIRDLVLKVRIGAYAREYRAPQTVRFAVEALVARGAHTAQDMRDVFSYDLMIDAIRMLIAAGHVELVETLAERIAEAVLAHPRVARVSVRIEKLETEAGVVGVAIERSRTREAATGPVLFDAAPVAATPAGLPR